MLEDDSGRIKLVGDSLKDVPLVTGCIIAVMGTETASGELDVAGVKFADLPPQPERWSLSKPPAKTKDEDVEMSDAGSPSSGTKLAIVSGLSFSGKNASHAVELDLLLEFLLGEALDLTIQKSISKITRLIVAGNSIARDEPDEKPDRKTTQKKYGYDASAYNPAPFQLLDDFFAELLPSIPVTVMPGSDDPATAAYPQQPVHAAMFPKSRGFAAEDASKPGWFDCVTNPWEGEVDGWRVLGTGGQNVDDVFKYIGSDDRLGMMEGMCRWRCIAPTAPDTLCKSLTLPLSQCSWIWYGAHANKDQGPTPSKKTSPSCSSPVPTSTSSAPSRASRHAPSAGPTTRPCASSPCRRSRGRARLCWLIRRRWRRRL